MIDTISKYLNKSVANWWHHSIIFLVSAMSMSVFPSDWLTEIERTLSTMQTHHYLHRFDIDIPFGFYIDRIDHNIPCSMNQVQQEEYTWTFRSHRITFSTFGTAPAQCRRPWLMIICGSIWIICRWHWIAHFFRLSVRAWVCVWLYVYLSVCEVLNALNFWLPLETFVHYTHPKHGIVVIH